jgi:hypothetical protein
MIQPTTFDQYKSKTNDRLSNARKDDLISISKERYTEHSIKARIYNSFLEYLILSFQEFFNTDCRSLTGSAILRKTLEQLITSRLINLEPEYYLKFYFGRILTSEEQISRYINRLTYEIELLKELDEKEKELHRGLSKTEILTGSVKALMDLVDEEASKTVNHHFDNVEIWGYGFLSHHLESKKLPYYQKELNRVKTLKEETAEKFVKEDFFISKYNTHQVSQVFSLFKDARPWSEKAKIVGLEKEYELLYSFTSSLIHFSSYSVFTEFELREDEKLMLANYFYQYVDKILNETEKMITNASC